MSSAEVCLESPCGTFRDPQGRLFREDGRILREIYSQHAETVLAWVRSDLAARWMAQGRLIATTVIAAGPDETTLLEHESVFFPSYPWEWGPGQWKYAATLTLDLCEEALGSGYILKDATPLNVLFSGSRPVFVDVLSFERRDGRSPLWMAYGQFVRTFLLPLAAFIHLGWPLAATQQRRDGYEPADLLPWISLTKRWLTPLRSLVTIPQLLQGSFFERSGQSIQSSIGSWSHELAEDTSAEIVRKTVCATRKKLNALELPRYESRWSEYARTADHYQAEDHAAKQQFVRSTLERLRPTRVLDVGANTGVYSRIAAEAGADVVAWDTDVQAVDLNWQTASKNGLRILPLVADFARPTPALGWRNSENDSLLARAKGRFDCVLMLGVLHHLLIAEQIPLAAVIDQLAQITRRWAVLEWIPQDDQQFSGLCRGREKLYEHLTETYFSEVLGQRFAVRNRRRLANGRTLWLAEKSA